MKLMYKMMKIHDCIELFGMLACYWSEATFFEWEQGDMLLLHNQVRLVWPGKLRKVAELP